MFHLLFIALSVVLAVFFAAWATGQYRLEQKTGYGVAAGLALVAGAALVVYANAFRRKTRNMRNM